MNKVQKIREEVTRIHNLLPVMDGDNISVNYADRICTTLEMYIDSLQEEPVSEELEEEIGKYCSNPENFITYIDVGFKQSSIEKDDIPLIIKAIKFGANWQKEQMMAKAVDATVHIDAGGYPYIPQIELYDYDKDILLAKEGDKYKVILIKEG